MNKYRDEREEIREWQRKLDTFCWIVIGLAAVYFGAHWIIWLVKGGP